MSMVTTRVERPGKVEVRNRMMPVPGGGQVLVRMDTVLLGQSDLQLFLGERPDHRYPFVPGRTGTGTVEHPGDAESMLVAGDRVLVMAPEPGREGAGIAGEYTLVPAARLMSLPAAMSGSRGAMLAFVAEGADAVLQAGSLRGRQVLVTGGGRTGQMLALVAAAEGADAVVLAQPDMALETPIHERTTLEPPAADALFPSPPVHERLQTRLLTRPSLSAGYDPPCVEGSMDIAVECDGSVASLRAAMACVRPGGTVVLAGRPHERQSLDYAMIAGRSLHMVGPGTPTRDRYGVALAVTARHAEWLDPDAWGIPLCGDPQAAYRMLAQPPRDIPVLLSMSGVARLGANQRAPVDR